jgi:phosphoglycerol transferase MdoB-like AlkP superfamily enzyme
MSNGNSSSNSGGIGVIGLLGVAFVVLKLTGYIDWSWWWVTAPFWGGFAFLLLIFAVVFAFTATRRPRSRRW